MSVTEVNCPFCLETIKAGAIRCKHCLADLTVLPLAPDPPSTSSTSIVKVLPQPRLPVDLELREVADVLAALVEKSLVAFEESSGRYRLLETVRQYAHERMLESGAGTEETWCVRHREHFLVLAEEAYEKRMTADAPTLMETMEREHDNCRAALDYCAVSSDAEPHLRLAGALEKFWEMRGYLREGRERLDVALSRPDGQGRSEPRARALNGAAMLAVMQNDARQARPLFEQSAEIWRGFDEKRLLALVLNNLGVLERQELRYDLAEALFNESLALLREVNDLAGMAGVLSNSGWNAYVRSDFARARALLEESIGLSRQTRHLYALELALSNLTEVAVKQGDYAAARALFREALEIQAEARNERSLAVDFEIAAELAVCLQRPGEGVRLFAAAAAMREQGGMPVYPDEHATYLRREELLLSALDAEAFAQEWEAGLAMTTGEALVLAQAIATAPENPA